MSLFDGSGRAIPRRTVALRCPYCGQCATHDYYTLQPAPEHRNSEACKEGERRRLAAQAGPGEGDD